MSYFFDQYAMYCATFRNCGSDQAVCDANPICSIDSATGLNDACVHAFRPSGTH
jgi:hypothetical protein